MKNFTAFKSFCYNIAIFFVYIFFKGAPKLQPKIIFMCITKMDGKTINTLNCYF